MSFVWEQNVPWFLSCIGPIDMLQIVLIKTHLVRVKLNKNSAIKVRVFRRILFGTETVAESAWTRALANMKTAIFLIGGVLVACSLYLSEAATLYRSGLELEEDVFDFDEDVGKPPNSTYHPPIVVWNMDIIFI